MTKTTEEIIMDAAIKVFTRGGYAAARTSDIAREAGINRALLHYYFRDKQTIFNLIFEGRFKEFFGGLFQVMQSEDSLEEKIRKIINHEIGTLILHPDLPRFIAIEVASRPELLVEYGTKLGLNPRMLIARFEELTRAEIAKGNIRDIDPKQLLINIMSLSIYPFVAQPIIRVMMQMDPVMFQQSMERRKQEVFEFVMNAIKKHA